MQLGDFFRAFLAEVKRRRVLEVVAIYSGLSFGLLQGADVVFEALRLSPTLLTALTILVLLGFPLALVFGWVYDLDAKGRIRRTPDRPHLPERPNGLASRRGSWRGRLVAALSLGVLVASSWLIANRVLNDDVAGAMTDPRGSYVVVPFQTQSATEESATAAVRAARTLTRQLNGWDSVRVVQSVALEGLMARLELEGGTAPTLERAFQLAEMLQAGTLIGLNVEATGDVVDLEVVTYDVASREEVRPPEVLHGSLTDLRQLVTPISQRVLELRDQSVSLEDLRGESRNPIAHQAFEDGLDALHDWRLEAAESDFRAAIAADPAFASAHHYLGLALYWQAARDRARILEVGPEIARAARAALRLTRSGQVRPGLLPHMEAFSAFWRGDYVRAKQIYGEMVEANPSDAEAWVLLGAVEYEDPVLRVVAPGTVRPRQSLNEARRAFETAARIAPDWQISYGHLFEIDRILSASALSTNCRAFERPDAPLRSPFEPMTHDYVDSRVFCPIVEDSIIWIDPAEFTPERRRRALEGVQRLAEGSRELLESWTRIHPDQARPHDELANWLGWRLATLGCRADASEVRQLTADIFAERSASLGLRADTTREDLVQLAMLNLALDDVAEATFLIDRALADLVPGTPVPSQAANVFLALGLPGRALEITLPVLLQRTYAIRDPEGEGPLSMGDIGYQIAVLKAYGATSLVAGPEIEKAFEDLLAEWSRRSYSPVQIARIKDGLLRTQGIGPALALDSAARQRWFEGWQQAGLVVPHTWRAFLGVESALNNVLADMEELQLTTLDEHYFAALLAREAGRHEEAVSLLLPMENCPLAFDTQSARWGLRTLGRWHLAQSYFALGDSVRGREALSSYTALRADRGPVGG